MGRNTGSKCILEEPAHGVRVGAHQSDLVEADGLVVEAEILHAAWVAVDAGPVGAFAEVLATHAALGRCAGVISEPDQLHHCYIFRYSPRPSIKRRSK